jgi:RNA polymerase sigma-70 factor (ECF subfamily)
MAVSDRDWTEVLRRIVEGDQLALAQAGRLVNGFLVRWNAYALRDEWDDLVQEVVCAGTIALRDGRIRDPGAVVSFLATTARFKYVDRLRILLGAGTGERLAWEDYIASGETPAEGLEAEVREDLRRALSKIPDKKREAVAAVYIGGLTYEEAAGATGIPLGTLKRYLRDGLAQLREELSERLERG